MRLDEALARYRTQLDADGRSPHTIDQVVRHVRALGRWLDATDHDDRVDALTHEDVAAFLTSDAARCRADGTPKRPTSTNALRSSLRTFFAFVHAAGYAKTNPARLVRRARCEDPPPRALSEDEQRRLLAALDDAEGDAEIRDRMMVTLMLATGLRLGATIGLDVRDVDIAAGELTVRTKGSRVERVVLPRDVGRRLAAFLGARTNGPVFESRHGQRLSPRQARARLALWSQRAGLRRVASPHALRHTFAMALYRRTDDLLLVQAALGHRAIASTTVYARADRRRLREVLAAG